MQNNLKMNSPCAFRRQELPYVCLERMRTIPLTQGKVAIVDDEDFEWLNQWKWHVVSRSAMYAARSMWKGNRKKLNVRMHRMILSVKNGMIVDHINGDSLDNRKSNLRVCRHANNMRNRKPVKGSSSRFIGVHFHIPRKKWVASLSTGNKYYYLGIFKNEEDAARARDIKATEMFGEFAYLNFPH